MQQTIDAPASLPTTVLVAHFLMKRCQARMVLFTAGPARAMSPIAAVTIAVSGISGISPFELVRRTFIPMFVAAVTTTITSLIVN